MSRTAPHMSLLRKPFKYYVMGGRGIRNRMIHMIADRYQVRPERVRTAERILQTLHTSSLMVDDIQDNDLTRRGKPACHIVYGTDLTIASAYYEIFDMIQTIGERERGLVLRALRDLHMGQGIEITWMRHQIVPSEEKFELMCGLKTGTLFRLASELLMTDPEVRFRLDRLMYEFGIHFQKMNDMKELDQIERVIWPLIRAIHLDPDIVDQSNLNQAYKQIVPHIPEIRKELESERNQLNESFDRMGIDLTRYLRDIGPAL